MLVGSDAYPRGICCWPLEASVVSKRPGEVLGTYDLMAPRYPSSDTYRI